MKKFEDMRELSPSTEEISDHGQKLQWRYLVPCLLMPLRAAAMVAVQDAHCEVWISQKRKFAAASAANAVSSLHGHCRMPTARLMLVLALHVATF